MKKNKIALLLLLPLTLSTAACSEIDAIELTAARQAATADERAEAIASFFTGAIEIETSVETSYGDYTYSITDQISSSARNTLTIRNEDGRVLERESYIADDDGLSVREYLSISNVVKQEELSTDFALNYGSPFASLTSANITSYFDATETSTGYAYSFNDLGLGAYNQKFITFYEMHDEYTWDDYSTADQIRNFNLYTDENGNPTSWDFYLVRSDRFGGIYEHYTSTLTAISACDALTSYEAASDETHATALTNAIYNLSVKLEASAGNFTEDFEWTVGDTTTTYSNYYDLFYTTYDDTLYESDEDALGIMLSDNPLEDSSYGTTYTGIAWGYVSSTDSSYNTTYTYGYYYLGVSPESDYYSLLSTDCWTSLAEVMPLVGDLSADFFSYDSTTDSYEWDLANFTYRSYESSLDIIYALFGVGDYPSAYQSNYVWDLDTTTFNFQNLSIKLDADGEIDTMTLDYINYNNVECSTTVSFRDFGTTDLTANNTILSCLRTLGVAS